MLFQRIRGKGRERTRTGGQEGCAGAYHNDRPKWGVGLEQSPFAHTAKVQPLSTKEGKPKKI